jgi:hypothetical protein
LIKTVCHCHTTSTSSCWHDDCYHLAKRRQMCKPLLCSSCLHWTRTWTGGSYHKDGMTRQFPLKATVHDITCRQSSHKSVCINNFFQLIQWLWLMKELHTILELQRTDLQTIQSFQLKWTSVFPRRWQHCFILDGNLRKLQQHVFTVSASMVCLVTVKHLSFGIDY